jgi:hypothetical protein
MAAPAPNAPSRRFDPCPDSSRTAREARVGVSAYLDGDLDTDDLRALEARPGRCDCWLASDPPALHGRARDHRSRLLAVVRSRLRRRQLRLTLPIALLAGVALSVINEGTNALRGQIDLGMCAMCAMNFVVPFIALKVTLLLSVRFPKRGTR